MTKEQTRKVSKWVTLSLLIIGGVYDVIAALLGWTTISEWALSEVLDSPGLLLWLGVGFGILLGHLWVPLKVVEKVPSSNAI